MATVEKRVLEEKTEVDAKRSKDYGVLRKQVEYYFSDQNLETDAFFHAKISSNAEGWLDMALILSCNKMQALSATKDDVLLALAESPLETKVDGDVCYVRRTVALPTLKPRHEKKAPKFHDGGCVIRISGVPAEKKWGDVKDIIKALLPSGGKVVFSTSVDEERCCTMLLSPFDKDQEFVKEKLCDLSMEDSKLTVTLCEGDDLKKALSNMPRHVLKKREMVAKSKAKARQQPILLGEQKFPNVSSLRSKVKEIISSRTDGMQLKPGSPDYNLVKSVLENHPRAEAKLAGMVGIKVDQSPQPGTRCFWVVREDGCEDISFWKCVDAIESKANAAAAAKAAEPKAAEPKAEEAKAEEAKVEEPKAEEPKAEEEPKVEA